MYEVDKKIIKTTLEIIISITILSENKIAQSKKITKRDVATKRGSLTDSTIPKAYKIHSRIIQFIRINRPLGFLNKKSPFAQWTYIKRKKR